MNVFSFVVAFRHDVQQRPQWWTRKVHRSVVEIGTRHSLMGFCDVKNSICERGFVLGFGTEHFIVENLARVIEHTAGVGPNEP